MSASNVVRLRPVNPLDVPRTVTCFRGKEAFSMTAEPMSMREIADAVLRTRARTKGELPWMKLATFGNARTPRRSLRHNANMVFLGGIEGDYDAGVMQPGEACAKLRAAGVAALVFTSASHTPEKPRWRLICPLSADDFDPGIRRAMVARANGVLGGVLAPESFTQTQAFYYGYPTGGAACYPEALLSEGRFLDEAEDLAAGAIYPAGVTATAAADRQPSKHGPEAAHLDDVVAALAAIPNPACDWEAWNRMGMTVWAATAGSDEGLAAWQDWSAKCPAHDDDMCAGRWEHYRGHPPELLGAGTLFHKAREAEPGWRLPSRTDGREFGTDPATPAAPATHDRHGNRIADEQPWRVIDVRALDGMPVPARRWIVPRWLPVGLASLHYADGGVGKTLLALQLMASCATGLPWCGMPVERCKSVGLFSEDDRDEIHHRLAAIADCYGIRLADLADMVPVDCVGQDNLLATFDRDGRMTITPRFRRLREQALDTGARLVIIDTAATAFGGNENDRSQVTRFVGGVLTNLARDIDGAVLLNAHPSRAGMASGSGDGASTAWSNSARSRWSLTKPRDDKGKVIESPRRELTIRKANMAAAGETILLNWTAGVFEAAPMAASGASDATVEAAFLAGMAALAEKGVNLSPSKRAGNYAPALLHKTPEAGMFELTALDRAMTGLMQAGRVVLEAYGPACRGRERLAVMAENSPAPEQKPSFELVPVSD